MTAATACSNNEVNKVNRGSEKSVAEEPVLNLEEKKDEVENSEEKDDEKVENESFVSGSVKKGDEQVSRSEFIELQKELDECKKKLNSLEEIVRLIKNRENIQNLQNLRNIYLKFIKTIENADYRDRCFFSNCQMIISELKWNSELEKEEMLTDLEHIRSSWENGIRKKFTKIGELKK